MKNGVKIHIYFSQKDPELHDYFYQNIRFVNFLKTPLFAWTSILKYFLCTKNKFFLILLSTNLLQVASWKTCVFLFLPGIWMVKQTKDLLTFSLCYFPWNKKIKDSTMLYCKWLQQFFEIWMLWFLNRCHLSFIT